MANEAFFGFGCDPRDDWFSEAVGVIGRIGPQVAAQIGRRATELAQDPQAAYAFSRERSMGMDEVSSALRLVFTLTQRAGSVGRPLREATAELEGLGLAPSDSSALEALLTAAETVGAELDLHVRRLVTLRSGVPKLLDVQALCDLRAVFERGFETGSPTPSGVATVHELVPLVILELSSLLNDEEQTVAVQLDAAMLDRLLSVLEVTRERLRGLQSLAEGMVCDAHTAKA